MRTDEPPVPPETREPLWLDPTNQWVRRGAETLRLTPKAFAVLRLLAEHAGQLVTKQALLAGVWPDTAVGDAVLATVVREIRSVLGDPASRPWLIETVHRRGYRLLEPLALEAPPPAAAAARFATSLPALVGRQAELERLAAWWDTALRGERRVIFVSGEPGIGKTALIDAFSCRHESLRDAFVGRGQCIEQLGAGEAYLPVLAALGDLCREPGGDRLVTLLRKHAPAWLSQMPAVLEGLGDAERSRLNLAGATRERMLREMTEALEAAAAERPFVLMLEDLHWSDSATLDLIALLARRRGAARLLVLGTYRSAEVIYRDHPLKGVKHELQLQGRCEDLALGSLDEAAVGDYLAARFGAGTDAEAPRDLARVLHERTDGIPLFVVSVVNDLVARGAIMGAEGRWTVRPEAHAAVGEVPASLRQLLERQLDQFGTAERTLLDVAAVAGLEFSAAAVAAGLELDSAAAEASCETLARREQWLAPRGSVEWPDGTFSARYGFVHALYRDVTYRRIPAALRARLHRRIGERAEAAFGARAAEIATELALHFEAGRDPDRAARHLEMAAANALRRSAAAEAVGLLRQGIDQLSLLPDTQERRRRELSMQSTLGAALTLTEGYVAAAVERAYARAWELCQESEDLSQLLPVAGLCRHAVVKGEHRKGKELAERMLRLTEVVQDRRLFMYAHGMLGYVLFWCGDFAEARDHLQRSRDLYDFEQDRFLPFVYGDDSNVAALAFLAFIAWLEGHPEESLALSRESLALARRLDHPPVLTLALMFAAQLRRLRGEVEATEELAVESLALADAHGLSLFAAVDGMLRGWAQVEQGRFDEGIAELHRSLDAYRAIGADSGLPQYFALLAEGYARAGQRAEALEAVRQALEVMERTDERWWEADLHRLHGELLRATPSSDADVEACFQRAIGVARERRARTLELRATTSLARLLRDRGRTAEARHILASICGAFGERSRTRDVEDAVALLAQLSTAASGAPEAS
jgi:DNA-binding winged helix-turn-helix (wHTH) protein/predicted ATPase